MGTLATKLVLLPPRDPESKGIVERRNRWFETSFMPGRTFRSPADFNTQFADWLTKANTRVVRTLVAAPTDRLAVDLAAILPLPPIPLHLGWRNRIRLGRVYYVRLDTNDYSVDPSMVGCLVDVTADLERVKVRANERVVADHPRVWARGTTVANRFTSRSPRCCASSSSNPVLWPRVMTPLGICCGTYRLPSPTSAAGSFRREDRHGPIAA